MHVRTINERSGCYFKGGWGEVCGRLWWEEKERKDNYNLKTVIMKSEYFVPNFNQISRQNMDRGDGVLGFYA